MCYQDDSLHLMAFDLMYCCRCYGYYTGLTYSSFAPKAKSSGKKIIDATKAAAEKRAQQAAKLNELQEQLLQYQTELADYELVSLIGTEVTSATYGVGVIVEQEENKITVQFAENKTSFMLHRKYAARPTFIDEQEIVDLMSNRADLMDAAKKVQQQIDRIIKEMS